MRYCSYYQAKIVCTAQSWLLVGVLRSIENLAFDRTLDKSSGLFEFFVPKAR